MDINKVFLSGRAGNDAEVREFTNGGSKTSVSIATTETFVSRSGEPQERTSWHNVEAWGGIGKVLAKVTKGALVTIEGTLGYDTVTDETSGKNRKVVKIKAQVVSFVSNSSADTPTTPQTTEPQGTTSSFQSSHQDDLPF